MLAALTFPQFDPVIFQFGPIAVRWYGAAYFAGFILGWMLAKAVARRYWQTASPPSRLTPGDIDDFLLFALLGVILGGRIGYVLFYYEFFLLPGGGFNWSQTLKIWEGGMSFHGGVLGVILAVFLFCRWKGLRFFILMDLIAMLATIGLFLGRIANFINGELFGRPSDLPWAMRFPERIDGILQYGPPRHPSQIYEALLEGLLAFLILFWLYRIPEVRKRPGLVSAAFLIVLGVFRFFVEFTRQFDAENVLLFGWITRGQQLSLPMIVIGFAILVWAWKRPRLDA